MPRRHPPGQVAVCADHDRPCRTRGMVSGTRGTPRQNVEVRARELVLDGGRWEVPTCCERGFTTQLPDLVVWLKPSGPPWAVIAVIAVIAESGGRREDRQKLMLEGWRDAVPGGRYAGVRYDCASASVSSSIGSPRKEGLADAARPQRDRAEHRRRPPNESGAIERSSGSPYRRTADDGDAEQRSLILKRIRVLLVRPPRALPSCWRGHLAPMAFVWLPMSRERRQGPCSAPALDDCSSRRAAASSGLRIPQRHVASVRARGRLGESSGHF